MKESMTNEELDEAIALALGWHKDEDNNWWEDTDGGAMYSIYDSWTIEGWHPTTNGYFFLKLLEIMREIDKDGWRYKIRISIQPPMLLGKTHTHLVETHTHLVKCHPKKRTTEWQHFQAADDEIGRSVCKAVLKALRSGS